MDNHGETACSMNASFETGRLETPWEAMWITSQGKLDQGNVKPPYIFRKGFVIEKTISKTVTVSHAEILDGKGDLYTENLRTAKARLIYISKGGIQTYEPRHTYMGFQYVKVEGIDASQIRSKTRMNCTPIWK